MKIEEVKELPFFMRAEHGQGWQKYLLCHGDTKRPLYCLWGDGYMKGYAVRSTQHGKAEYTARTVIPLGQAKHHFTNLKESKKWIEEQFLMWTFAKGLDASSLSFSDIAKSQQLPEIEFPDDPSKWTNEALMSFVSVLWIPSERSCIVLSELKPDCAN